MAQRICFLGRGGSGKSTVAQNLGHALALKGYHVLLVGNDISLSSTVLLRGEADISPALEDYREHYEIDLNDYVIPTPSGVYCLELGSIDPGVGCLARGVTLIDEMLDTQGVSNSLQLDFILYDISGETPCTGYILPIREGVMQRCIIVTNGSFASVTTANSILQAILRAAGADAPVRLGTGGALDADALVEATGLPEGVMGSAYLAPDGKKLVFVAVNEDTASQTVTLAGVPEGAWSEVYETSMERDCSTSRGFMKADNGYALPAQSVTTFVFQLA